ncbi:unnamed protein product [Prorocentrum cordatum]|uniref:Uncharacterized protein n=1 Tax=Prorocentrum cordatum TaxID=2364126 RepID=A0ABN9YFM0_9DINO|nr:unnamed protein product [Polarella glacialis]
MARIRAPLRPAPSWLAARTGGPRHERPVGARRAGRCTRCGGKRLAGSECAPGRPGVRLSRSRAPAGLPPQPPRPAESRGPEDTSGEGRRSCAWARCVPYRAGRAAARRPARARPMRRRRCDGEPERRRRGTRVVLLPACLRHTAQT